MRRTVAVAQLNHESEELARLAQLVPPDIAQVEKGTLPKDLSKNLKQIEKLCKQIRRQLGL